MCTAGKQWGFLKWLGQLDGQACGPFPAIRLIECRAINDGDFVRRRCFFSFFREKSSWPPVLSGCLAALDRLELVHLSCGIQSSPWPFQPPGITTGDKSVTTVGQCSHSVSRVGLSPPPSSFLLSFIPSPPLLGRSCLRMLLSSLLLLFIFSSSSSSSDMGSSAV